MLGRSWLTAPISYTGRVTPSTLQYRGMTRVDINNVFQNREERRIWSLSTSNKWSVCKVISVSRAECMYQNTTAYPTDIHEWCIPYLTIGRPSKILLMLTQGWTLWGKRASCLCLLTVFHGDAASSKPGSHLFQTRLLCLSYSCIQEPSIQGRPASEWLVMGRRQCSSWDGLSGDAWLKFAGSNEEQLWGSFLGIMNQGLSSIPDKEEPQLWAAHPLSLWSCQTFNSGTLNSTIACLSRLTYDCLELSN